eukprot:111330_1
MANVDWDDFVEGRSPPSDLDDIIDNIPRTPRPHDRIFHDIFLQSGGPPKVHIPNAPFTLAPPKGMYDFERKQPHEIKFRSMALMLEDDPDSDSEFIPRENVRVRFIMKIGGAAVTEKNSECTLKPKVLAEMADHLRECFERFKKDNRGDAFVLVHGAGSFGHHTASKFSLKSGMKQHAESPVGFARTCAQVHALAGHIIGALVARGVPAVLVSPSAFMRTHDGKCSDVSFVRMVQHVKSLLSTGLVPIIHGDVVLDTVIGCSILSGDAITEALVRAFSAPTCVFATDVRGVFDRNPTDTEAKLLTKIGVYQDGSLDVDVSFEKENGSISSDGDRTDVTGSMQGKLQSAKNCSVSGCRVYIVEGGSKTEQVILRGEHPTDDCTLVYRLNE